MNIGSPRVAQKSTITGNF